MSFMAITIPRLHVIELEVLLGEERQMHAGKAKTKGTTKSYKEGNTTE